MRSNNALATVVDRTVHQKIPPPASGKTPSSPVSAQTEFLHRIHGTSILYQVTKLLRLSPSVYATSTTIFHRFFHRSGCSLQKYDVWSVAMASVLLACKTEEEIRRIREIILVFVHVYRRMRMGVGSDEDVNYEHEFHKGADNDHTVKLKHITVARCSYLKDKRFTYDEKKNSLRHIRPLSQNGMLYREWEDAIMEMENVILRELGFTLNWITESHPHVFLLYFLKVLNVNVNVNASTNENKNADSNTACSQKKIGQTAWNYCNDSCRLDLCVRYSPELTACAAIHLALMEENIVISPNPKPWWHAFIGDKCDEDLSIVCNAILALGDRDCVDGYMAATKEYVVSLVDGGSFCDPGSYIWNDISY